LRRKLNDYGVTFCDCVGGNQLFDGRQDKIRTMVVAVADGGLHNLVSVSHDRQSEGVAMIKVITALQAAQMVRWFNLIALYAINLSLLIAFYYQFVFGELPCPLCLLQRVALIMVGIGFLLNIRCGSGFLHYGLIILSALAGMVSSGRQVLLHIIPGTDAFGSALFGLHFYTWALISFMLVLLGVGLIMLIENCVGDERLNTICGRTGQWAGLLLLVIVLVNLLSTFLECGLGSCPDNPTAYLLLTG
jgi:disulfide bond formation protein DsbB